jgi:cytochrome P450
MEVLKLMAPESTGVSLRTGFDHATGPELVGASFGGWSRLRAESPAFRSDIGGTYDLWYLLRYADIRAALQDHELFSSRSVQYLGDSAQRMLPEELDPPEHAKYRRLLNVPLSLSAVRAREEQIRTLCVTLIDDIAPRGECDFLTGFAQRFPTTIFLDLMGLPTGKAAEFIARAQTVLHVTGEQDPDFSVRATAAMAIIDGGQYHDPDEFKLDRFPNAHLAFGAGAHFCAGAHLARLELRIALEEWHRRIPDYELAAGKPVTEYVGAVAGLTALPLRWQPAPGRPPHPSQPPQNRGDRDD